MWAVAQILVLLRRAFFSVTLKMLNFFTVFALLPYEPFTNERLLLTTTTQIVREYLKQNWPSLILVEFSWRSIVFPKLTDVTYHHIPLAAKIQGFIDYCGIIKLTGVFMFHS